MNFPENFEELLRAFSKHNVEYMLVGGYALNFHGYNRSTSDLDVWTKGSQQNKQKILAALQSLGFKENELEHITALDFNQSFLFNIGDKPDYIQIFNTITGVKYEAAEQQKMQYEFADNLLVDFIHWRDLVTNKMLTGRERDKADVEELQKIIRMKKGNT